MSQEKVCRSCGKVKPIDGFGRVKSEPRGRRASCKDCYNKVRALYRKSNGDKISAYKKQLYYKNHEEQKARLRARYPKVRAWKLLRDYGLTVEQYEDMLAKQGECCAICKKQLDEEGKFSKPRVDHDHKTGKVRGILCGKCNVAIGCFKDSIKNLKSAIKYLKGQQHDDSAEVECGGGFFLLWG